MAQNEEELGRLDRRDVLRIGTAGTMGLLVGGLASAGQRVMPPMPENPRTAGAMPTRNLGRTGFRVGLFSLGGQAAIEQPENEAIAVPLVERALDLGVNYIDTSARYGGAEERWSERYIGQAIKNRRAELFLASKTHDRSRDGSWRLLERSLDLLATDHLDLWQVHNLSRMEQLGEIFAPDGAMRALIEARDQGVVRFLGVSGHADPAVLEEAIERFPFDTILLAINAADPSHLSFRETLLPLAVEKEMGIIGMKIPARGLLLSSWSPPPPEKRRRYEKNATRGTLDMREALRYAYSLPISTAIVGCDSIAQLEENVALTRSFTPLSAAQMAALEERAAPIHRQALFFRRWETG
jgi:aryl-alcohol dehydrogenase-like predicted oxidoreductase